jgi:DNA polymerase-3 subunit alpha
MEVSELQRRKLSVVEVEEIKVVTKLTMASRKLKIKISNELLMELEKMQVNFELG